MSRPEGVQAQVQRQEDVLFALEVVVEGGLGEAQRVGDLAQRRLVVAVLGEQVEGDVQDALPGVEPRWPAVRLASARPTRRSRPEDVVIVGPASPGWLSHRPYESIT